MITPRWRGWTRPADADAYESLLADKMMPGLQRIAGYQGGYVLRRDDADDQMRTSSC